MSAKILVKIPCYERKAIAEQCIPTVARGLFPGDCLTCYNDGSKEYNTKTMVDFYAHMVHDGENIGIERQRRMHFENFMKADKDFTHLYLTDLDAIHDPCWREKALNLQNRANGAPVCLYNTMAHENLVGNTIETGEYIVWRKFAPGISYLLTRGHVEKIVNAIKDLPDPLHWDWTVPAIMGYRMAISRVSFVDHIGLGGLHHGAADINSGDRALNPTWWLTKKRERIIQVLTAQK